MKGKDRVMDLMRKRENLEQILENEIELRDDAC